MSLWCVPTRHFIANFTYLPKRAHFKNKLLVICLLRGPSWSDTYLLFCSCFLCAACTLAHYIRTTLDFQEPFNEILKIIVSPTTAPIRSFICAVLSVGNAFPPPPVTDLRSTDLVKLTATNHSCLKLNVYLLGQILLWHP